MRHAAPEDMAGGLLDKVRHLIFPRQAKVFDEEVREPEKALLGNNESMPHFCWELHPNKLFVVNVNRGLRLAHEINHGVAI
jgi:hypothetical protein